MENRRLIDLGEIKPIDFPSTEMDGLDVVRYLNTLPTVDAVEVVHGQWVEKYVYDPDPHDRVRYKCSICGRTEVEKEPYCNCGAKMDGDGNG